MKKDRIRILLVENNHDDVAAFDELVTEINGSGLFEYQLIIVPALTIQEAREYLDVDTTDVLVLALTLPDGTSKDIISRLESFYCDIPTITLVHSGDAKSGKDSIRHGVQDYLVKGTITAERLFSAVINAMERHKLIAATQSGSMTDDLTQLYNARGFHKVVRHGIALAKRRNLGLTVVYVDIDDLSQINKEHGTRGGEASLKAVAMMLKNSFRESDIIARLGSDDFIIVSIGSSAWAETSISMRIDRTSSDLSGESRLQWETPVSYGSVFIEKDFSSSIDEYISLAQKKMYEYRRSKRASRGLRSEAV